MSASQRRYEASLLPSKANATGIPDYPPMRGALRYSDEPRHPGSRKTFAGRPAYKFSASRVARTQCVSQPTRTDNCQSQKTAVPTRPAKQRICRIASNVSPEPHRQLHFAHCRGFGSAHAQMSTPDRWRRDSQNGPHDRAHHHHLHYRKTNLSVSHILSI